MDKFSSKLPQRSGGGQSGRSRPQSRLSRRDQESRQQRLFVIGLAAIASLIVIILAIGVTYEYVIKPNQVLAEVNGEEIQRSDYWQYESVNLYNQARQYEDFAGQTEGEQQMQFLSFAQQFDQQRNDLWGSTDVNEATIEQMIENKVYLEAAGDLGIEVSQDELQDYALNIFADPEAPLVDPVPQPTMIPERAAWAEETAEAEATMQAELEAEALGTPVAATPEATPIPAEATPVPATPEVDGTPLPADATPEPEGTPSPEDFASAESGYQVFQTEVLDDANLSEDDFMEMYVRPLLARELVNAELVHDVSQTAEQVNAQHILVGTEDLANQLQSEIEEGADFDAVAEENSIDTATAANGGDLGWFTRGQMVEPFEDVAFELEPSEMSDPVQTEFGWHLIKVNDHDVERPLTDQQYEQATSEAVGDWINEQRQAMDISSDYVEEEPEPAPEPEQFVPPADAPVVEEPAAEEPFDVTEDGQDPLQGPVVDEEEAEATPEQ